MKAIFFSDIHFHFWEKHNKGNKRIKSQMAVFEKVIRLGFTNKCPIFFLGDLFNNPGEVTNKLLNYISTSFSQVFKEYPGVQLYLISGNHDMSEKNTILHRSPSYAHAFSTLFPNIHNLDFNSVTHEGTTFHGIPYLEDNAGLVEYSTKFSLKGEDILLIHTGFRGQKDTSGVVVSEGFNITEQVFDRFKYVLSGHIHKPGRVRQNIFSVGAPLQLRASDSEGKFGYWVLTDTGNLKFKELLGTPKFRYYTDTSEINNETDIWIKKPSNSDAVSVISPSSTVISPLAVAKEYCRSIGVKSKTKINFLTQLIREANDHI